MDNGAIMIIHIIGLQQDSFDRLQWRARVSTVKIEAIADNDREGVGDCLRTCEVS